MDIEKIIHHFGKKQHFKSTVNMLLSNSIDYGSEDGGHISAKRYGEIEGWIKQLMRIAWEHGRIACTCGECDYCAELGTDSFEKFINEFSNYC